MPGLWYSNADMGIMNLLLYGGVTKEQYDILKRDIDNYNRKNLIIYSILGIVFCGALIIVTSLLNSAITKNRMLYVIGAVVFLAILTMSSFFSKKTSVFLNISKYMFMILTFGMGILLAVNSYYDISASYMVLLFAIPPLFLMKPIVSASMIILTDIVYLIIMRKLQTPDLFSKDFINAVVFGVLSICISTSIISVKTKSLESDYINKKLMLTDRLTGAYNRQAFMDLISSFDEKGIPSDTACIICDLNGLKFANDNHGHWVGDKLIIAASNCLNKAFGEYGQIFRIGGDEFCAVLNVSQDQLNDAVVQFNQLIEDHNKQNNDSLSISMGCSRASDAEYGTFEEISRIADSRMYQDKRNYYQQKGKGCDEARS